MSLQPQGVMNAVKFKAIYRYAWHQLIKQGLHSGGEINDGLRDTMQTQVPTARAVFKSPEATTGLTTYPSLGQTDLVLAFL